MEGLNGIQTQIARFKVWSANHYTMKHLMLYHDALFIYMLYPLQVTSRITLIMTHFYLQKTNIYRIQGANHLVQNHKVAKFNSSSTKNDRFSTSIQRYSSMLMLGTLFHLIAHHRPKKIFRGNRKMKREYARQ